MSTKNGTALIAEDQHAVRVITADLLELAGFHVQEAPSTAEAIDQLRRRDDITLVVADLSLPEGEVLAGTIRCCCPFVKLLLIASGPRPAPRYLPMDVAFLGRPYTPAALALQLARLGYGMTHRLGLRSEGQQRAASLERLRQRGSPTGLGRGWPLQFPKQ